MTRILDPGPVRGELEFARDNAGISSPNEKHIAVLLTHGDVSSNTNVYRLVVYEAASLFTKPQSKEVLRMNATSNRPGIAKLKWLSDSRRIAFLGERARELPQVWIVDTQTGELTRVTRHETEIRDYDITPDGTAWAYRAAPSPKPASSEFTERGFVFAWPAQSIGNVMAKNYSVSPPAYFSDVYIGRKNGGNDVRVPQQTQYVTTVSIAPDGRHAVELMQIEKPPDSWDSYIAEPAFHRLVLQARDKANRGPDTYLYQYFLIDVASGTPRPLTDGPAGQNATSIYWTEDSREAILQATFLPPSVPGAATQFYNNVISVDIQNRRVSPIRSSPDHRWLAVASEGPRAGLLPVRQALGGTSSVHKKIGSVWREVEAEERPYVTIAVKQGTNDPPELEAREWNAGKLLKSSVISRLNPQLDELILTHVKTYNWRSKDGLPWKGLMYLPPQYTPGTRYPLVIQTHGFHEQEFQPDGVTTTAMAAQALANSNMIVIQLSGPTEGWAPQSIKIADQWLRGIEALIDALDQQEYLDRTKVGLIGWSYTGWLVEYFLSHSSYTIGAAIAADNIEYNYFQYILHADSTFGVSWFEDIYGGSPWQKPDSWAQGSSAANLLKINSPLRIEAELDTPLDHWELYVGLKLLHRPVELVVIPNSNHSLIRPWHRLTSQGGSVDWFRFWLKGEEDPDRAKAAQYERWREMRDQHRAANN